MLPTLSEIIRGESPWLVDELLVKGQSVILSSTDARANSLLALQLALDVASGKEFLGKFPTSRGDVLFLNTDMARLKRDAEMLSRKSTATDNIRVGPGTERDIVALIKNTKPSLTVVDLGQNEQLWNTLSALGSIIAVSGGSWRGTLTLPVWALNAKPEGYALQFREKGLSANLARREAGFLLESIEALKPGTPPKFDNRQVAPMRPWTSGIALERTAPVTYVPQY